MARAGRNRKAGPRRQPGGRIDHSSRRAMTQRAEDMTAVVLEARQRVHQVSPTVARLMPETSFLGHLMASGGLSDGTGQDAAYQASRRYRAANRFKEIIEEYDRLHPIRGFPHSSPFDKMGGHDDSDGTAPGYVAKAQMVGNWWLRADHALRQANKVDSRARGAVERIVLHDYKQPHLVDALKVALDHLIDGLDIP